MLTETSNYLRLHDGIGGNRAIWLSPLYISATSRAVSYLVAARSNEAIELSEKDAHG